MESLGGGIIWLASYPKSGNTWFRMFYTNLIQDGDAPASLSQINPPNMASSRSLFDDYAGVESADLTQEQIERLRPRVYEAMTREVQELLLLKIHDAYTMTPDGEPLVSQKATRGAIYFLRNPLDVAVSFAHHSVCDLDTIIKRMADESYCFESNPNRISTQLRQRLLTWSTHVTGWVDGLGTNLHLMRYEDMVLTPEEIFTRAVRFAQLPDDPARIQKALRFSDIGELQKQEQSHGFKEKYHKTKNFFREGKIGSWREVLSHQQVARIIRDHGAVMKRFGYLDDNNEPLF